MEDVRVWTADPSSMEIALHRRAIHPIESVESIWLKVLVWNACTGSDLWYTVAFRIYEMQRRNQDPDLLGKTRSSPQALTPVDVIRHLLVSIRLEPHPARNAESLVDNPYIALFPALRICPTCFSKGYHFALHQLRAYGRCPEDGTDLEVAADYFGDERLRSPLKLIRGLDSDPDDDEAAAHPVVSALLRPAQDATFPNIEAETARLLSAPSLGSWRRNGGDLGERRHQVMIRADSAWLPMPYASGEHRIELARLNLLCRLHRDEGLPCGQLTEDFYLSAARYELNSGCSVSDAASIHNRDFEKRIWAESVPSASAELAHLHGRLEMHAEDYISLVMKPKVAASEIIAASTLLWNEVLRCSEPDEVPKPLSEFRHVFDCIEGQLRRDPDIQQQILIATARECYRWFVLDAFSCAYCYVPL